ASSCRRILAYWVWVDGVAGRVAAVLARGQGSVELSGLFAGARTPLVIGFAAVSALALSGCMGSPTYGTDKTANEQLIEDLTGVLALGPKRQPQIEYQPRPELVKPE